jgi:hypothetical protein
MHARPFHFDDSLAEAALKHKPALPVPATSVYPRTRSFVPAASIPPTLIGCPLAQVSAEADFFV